MLSFTSRGELAAARAIPSKQVAYLLINSILSSADRIIYRLCIKIIPDRTPSCSPLVGDRDRVYLFGVSVVEVAVLTFPTVRCLSLLYS